MTVGAAMHYCLFDTDLGACGVAWSERGVARFQLPEATRRATEQRLMLRAPNPRAEAPPPRVQPGIDIQTATPVLPLGPEAPPPTVIGPG